MKKLIVTVSISIFFAFSFINCHKEKLKVDDETKIARPTIEESQNYIERTIKSIQNFPYIHNVREGVISDSEIIFDGENVIYSHNQIETKGTSDLDLTEINIKYEFNLNDIDGVSRDYNDAIILSLKVKNFSLITPLNGTSYLNNSTQFKWPVREIKIRCPQSKQTELLNAFDNIKILLDGKNGSNFFKDSVK